MGVHACDLVQLSFGLYVVEASPEFLILLSPPPPCWGPTQPGFVLWLLKVGGILSVTYLARIGGHCPPGGHLLHCSQGLTRHIQAGTAH